MKIAGNFALTTGKIGGKVKAFDFGLGGSYTKGGASQGIELYIEIDTKTGAINVGASYIQKHVHKESSMQYGPFHGSESEEKVTKRDIKT